jgi:signal transduction histidine kinase
MSRSGSRLAVEQIIVTEVLSARRSPPPDHAAEARAFYKLIEQMAEAPDKMLQKLVEVAVELCNAGTAGVSLLDQNEAGEEIFRWVAVAGAHKDNIGGTTPANFSPCGTCLERGRPVLYSYPAQFFEYLAEATPEIVEELVIPLRAGGRKLGTAWIVSHDPATMFTAETVRVMSGIANFAAATLSFQQLEKEMHRVAGAKDDFIAMMAHDLLTPLTAILGWVGLIRTGKLGAFDEKALGAIEGIERNARLQHRIMTNLLDLARISAGGLQISKAALNLANSLWQAVDTVAPEAVAKQIELDVVISKLNGEVWGEEVRLQQVFQNILVNALKFTSSGRIVVRLQQVDSFAEVRITDTGCGISPQFLPNVFHRFRQEDRTRPKAGQGLGLGLAIVKDIVELHGGSVQADSDGPGKGATFTVRLPLVVSLPRG